MDTARLRLELGLDQKQRLQQFRFPKGLPFSKGIFGSTKISLSCKLIAKPEAEKLSLATLPGIEPGLPP